MTVHNINIITEQLDEDTIEETYNLFTAIKESYTENETRTLNYDNKKLTFDKIIINTVDSDSVNINISLKYCTHITMYSKTFTDIVGVGKEFKIIFNCLRKVTDVSKQEISNELRNNVIFYNEKNISKCKINIPIERIYETN